MKLCSQARRLFGAYWDDETSQAEREWLETHLGSCAACRTEYEALAQTLEHVASLPRHEASPDLLERTLARARRTAPEPDRVHVPTVGWAPAMAAAAAVLVVAAIAVWPWMSSGPGSRIAGRDATSEPRQPVLVELAGQPAQAPQAQQPAAAKAPTADLFAEAAVPDTLFDHGEDVEFILDPVTVNRGRATMNRLPGPVEGQQAVITF